MTPNKKYNFTIPLLTSVAVSIGMLIGYKLHSNMPISKSFFTSKEKTTYDEVIELVKKRYVDDVKTDSIGQIAIQSVLSTLDPHSNFIPESELKEVNETLEGKFEGIGVEFNVFSDTVHIVSVIRNGPSEKANLQVGDMILKVNDSSAIGSINAEKFKKWVKGPAGTPVSLTISRNGKVIKQEIIRRSIPLTSIDASYMIDGEAGYLKLNRFSGNTYREFMVEMEKLKSQGMTKLILDLRDNGGGILEEAIDIADEFIEADKLIVFTEGKHSPKKEFKAKRPGIFEEGKIIVIMNESSASASEVLAGALQDHDRAMIVGMRSFGKGLVQEQFSLSDGSALRLTTARYYTPLGRSIQKSYFEGSEKYHQEIYSRMQESKPETTKLKQRKEFKTPKGKVLYDNEGITPDQIIARDIKFLDSTVIQIFENNLIGKFSYRTYLLEKDNIKKFKNQSEYYELFNNDSRLMNTFKTYSQSEKLKLLPINEKGIPLIINRIKAQIARLAWDESAYFYVINKEDPAFQAAVAALN
jgi:carboxyl-terminal processing protease